MDHTYSIIHFEIIFYDLQVLGFVGGVVGLFEQSFVDITDAVLEAYRNQVIIIINCRMCIASIAFFFSTLPLFLTCSEMMTLSSPRHRRVP